MNTSSTHQILASEWPESFSPFVGIHGDSLSDLFSKCPKGEVRSLPSVLLLIKVVVPQIRPRDSSCSSSRGGIERQSGGRYDRGAFTSDTVRQNQRYSDDVRKNNGDDFWRVTATQQPNREPHQGTSDRISGVRRLSLGGLVSRLQAAARCWLGLTRDGVFHSDGFAGFLNLRRRVHFRNYFRPSFKLFVYQLSDKARASSAAQRLKQVCFLEGLRLDRKVDAFQIAHYAATCSIFFTCSDTK